MCVLPVLTSIYHVCVCSAHRGQKTVLDPQGVELTVVCELTFGHWERNPGPLEEQNH